MELFQCRITNAVKCLPPQNKPLPVEITTCNNYLKNEIAGLKKGAVILALGTIAHTAVLRTQGLKLSAYPFGHGHQHALPAGHWLLDSYHCSRYNTQTRRLAEKMFQAVFEQARGLLNLKTAVGRGGVCGFRGAGQGATTRNGCSIPRSCNAAMRTENRAIRPVAGFTRQVNPQDAIKFIKNILLAVQRSGQLPFLG